MALLFSHQLTDIQEREAKEVWGVNQFLSLPDSLQKRWSSIPPEGSFSSKWLQPILFWLEEKTSPNDLVLIQGEFGAVYTMVTWCHNNERLPVYATTKRRFESCRLPDGSNRNRHVFQHVNFRRYPLHVVWE